MLVRTRENVLTQSLWQCEMVAQKIYPGGTFYMTTTGTANFRPVSLLHHGGWPARRRAWKQTGLSKTREGRLIQKSLTISNASQFAALQAHSQISINEVIFSSLVPWQRCQIFAYIRMERDAMYFWIGRVKAHQVHTPTGFFVPTLPGSQSMD